MHSEHVSLVDVVNSSTVHGWTLTKLPTKQVDLPAMPKQTLGDLVNILTDNQTDEEIFQEGMLESARQRVSTALVKTVSTQEDGVPVIHRCTIEYGAIQEDKPQEFLITYKYQKNDYTLTVTASNRRTYDDDADESIFSVRVEGRDVPLRRNRKFPYIMYTFEDNRCSIVYSYGNVHVGYFPLTKDSQFSLKPIPKILFPGGLDKPSIDGDQTLKNLLANINSESPIEPLSCLTFL